MRGFKKLQKICEGVWAAIADRVLPPGPPFTRLRDGYGSARINQAHLLSRNVKASVPSRHAIAPDSDRVKSPRYTGASTAR
jgi:hypothetical protein